MRPAIFVALCVAVLCGTAAASDPFPLATTSPPRPHFGDAFIAVNVTAYQLHSYVVGSAEYYISNPSELHGVMNISGQVTEFVVTGGNTNIVVNNACVQTGGVEFQAFMLTWLDNATYAGTTTLSNYEEAAVWSFVADDCSPDIGPIPATSCNFTFYASVPDSLPLAVDLAYVYKGQAVSYSLDVLDYESGPSALPAGIFDLPSGCLPYNNTCPAAKPREMTLYRNEDLDYGTELVNVDAADPRGEAFWLCSSFTYNTTAPYLVQYNVTVNATWGSYAYCNGGFCDAIQKEVVGRKSPTPIGTNVGQCLAPSNMTYGAWYSFIDTALCKDNTAPIGDDGCAYTDYKVVKIIEASCLLDRGMDKVCDYADLSPAAKIMVLAMESDDPDKGGCPAYIPPTTAAPSAASPRRDPRTNVGAAALPDLTSALLAAGLKQR